MRPCSWHRGAMVLLLALAGCGRDEPAAPAMRHALPLAAVAQAVDVEPALILPDLMDLVIDPAAGVLLAAAQQPARPDREPRTDAAWQAVADAAAELARTSEMLAAPALARGRADWLDTVAAMREGAAAGRAAARRHDPRALFAAGAQLRSGCEGCHARYAAGAGPVDRADARR